jgi:hypothetical protein
MNERRTFTKYIIVTFLLTTFIYVFILGAVLLNYGVKREGNFISYKNKWHCNFCRSVPTTINNRPDAELINKEIAKFNTGKHLRILLKFQTNDELLLVTEHDLLGLTCFYRDFREELSNKTYTDQISNDFFYPHSY